MIADLRPYPAMKDSGVDWLGDIPEHWEVWPNRALFDEIKDRDCPDEQMLSVTIKKGVIRQTALLEDTSKKDSSNLDKSKYKLVQLGDIAYNKMRAWQGAFGVSEYRGIISPAYIVQRPRAGSDHRYFHYLLRTPAFAEEAERWSYGITSDMWSLRPEHFKMIYVCLPPLPEQDAIVRFLNHMDRRIRRFIRNRRRLIEVLNEQKQAIINRAVTRGLNPNVPLKPSGIDWLGDIPEHWRILPLKRWVATKITDGPHETPPLLDKGIDFVSAEAMVNGEIVFERRRGFISRSQHEIYCMKCRPQRDDIFMCKSGNTTGKVAFVDTDGEFSVWSPLALIRCKSDWALPRLMFVVLQATYVQKQVQDRWSYGTQPNLSMAAMERIVVALPPTLYEQIELLGDIESQTDVIDRAISKAGREIDLIREYRIRLIADVVTGKVDVRHLASKIGEVEEDPEPFEADEDIDDEEMQGDNEPELVEEEADASE